MGDANETYKKLNAVFLDNADNAIGFKGKCLKIVAFVDDYFDGFSESSEKEQKAFLAFVREQEKVPPSVDRLENSFEERAKFYRNLLPEWEKLRDEYFTRAHTKAFANHLFATRNARGAEK